MANFINTAVCVYLVVLCSEVIHGHPLTPKDVEDLLPETPRTKNDTIAAIVKDSVVQEAVQSIVANGTLSGLVIKKNTVILPADEPNKILSQNEQILTAPLSHLEDIRKNITEAVAAITEKENSEIENVEEISLAQVVPIDGEIGADRIETVSPNAAENSGESLIAGSLVLETEPTPSLGHSESAGVEIGGLQKLQIPAILETAIKLPEGIVPQNIILPDVISHEISEPIVAVFNADKKSNANDHTDQESVIALLPAGNAADLSHSTIVNAEENEKQRIGTQYGDKIPVEIITTQEFDHPAVKIETGDMIQDLDSADSKNNLVAIFAVPAAENEKGIFYEDEDGDNDMVAAEDIIFRPLFRYRQQQNDRTRILQNRAYLQRPAYNNYNRFRSRDDYYYSNGYHSRGNAYRKSYSSRYSRDN